MTVAEPEARRRRPLLIALVVGVAAIGIVGIFIATQLFAMRACGCIQPTPELPSSPVVGVVVAVDSAGLGQVSGFSLRVDGGWAFKLALGPLENAAEFSPSHLAEHLASSEPIRAFYRLEGGAPVVYRLEDAVPQASGAAAGT